MVDGEDKLASEHDGEIEVVQPMLNVAARHVDEWVCRTYV